MKNTQGKVIESSDSMARRKIGQKYLSDEPIGKMLNVVTGKEKYKRETLAHKESERKDKNFIKKETNKLKKHEHNSVVVWGKVRVENLLLVLIISIVNWVCCEFN